MIAQPSILPPQPATRRAGFYPAVHGARGLFSLLVVIYHVWNSGLPHWNFPMLIQYGLTSLNFGVELFFAVSGFVIFFTMSGSSRPLAFLINRATRILPVLWVTIIVFLPLGILNESEKILPLLDTPVQFLLVLVGNLFALGPVLPVTVFYGVAWTLSYEFTFYVLCFVYLAGKVWLRVDLRWPVLLGGLALVVLMPRALFFLAGIIVALGWTGKGAPAWLARFPGLLLIVFLASWQWASAPESPFFFPIYTWTTPDLFLGAAIAFGAAVLMMEGLKQEFGLFSRLLMTRPMQFLGTVSFSLYLWHPMVLGTVKFMMYKLGIPDLVGGASQPLFLAVTLPISLVIAYLSYRILEVRVTRALRLWLTPKVPKDQTIAISGARSR